jgi:excisionase family DNA binding protein
MCPTLRELLEAPEGARSLAPEAMTEVIGELVLLLARLLVQTTVMSASPQTVNPEALDRLLTVDEVSGILSLRPARVYELIRMRRLPGLHVGKHVRVRSGDLQAWIEGQREKVVDTKFEPSLSSPPPMTRPSTKARGKQSR